MTPEKTNPTQDRQAADKPFPWRCPRCLKKTVNVVTMPHTAKASYDGRVHELEIPQLEIPQCASCGELVFSNRVDEQISHALRLHLRLLTPEQIRAARDALGLQQKELSERLGVAREIMCRWETGVLIQSRAMDNLLRLYFGLPQVRTVLIGGNQDPEFGTRVGVQV
jgi:putative zinc finger/helix-turn-helix YgiT family protein